MKSIFPLLLLILLLPFFQRAQCVTCGNGIIDGGETNSTCPQDISHAATCTSPCSQPTSFETNAGTRQAFDFVGTTTFAGAALPAGWLFAGAPTPTTTGALPAADVYGAKGGLVQPNCSGSCVATNGFCIGNLASTSAVGGGGLGGKLGANFDGRPNIATNLSYAVLRGQSSPTLVSPTFNMSAINGFKVQFWLFPSETSCGQLNSWGSCVGNVAYLDFSSNGGTSWTQVLTMNLSSASSDMCFNNSTNTKWLTESAWSRVCLTVFKTTSAEGNFYPVASGSTAASGVMVNSTFFTNNFKFRVRYSQTASCTSGITATNPGRYLAIDFPVITSGNEMIPCGISFPNMCGYGADNNDDGVGSSTLTTTTTAFGTVKRGVNNAERGVEILTSQTSIYASQNLTGSNFATNFDLCNAEGGDRQCIDWRTNNNFYTTVYECITDWEAASGTGINLQYYKGTTPQSTGMSKVTTAGKTALIGWRYSANRFVSCSSLSDLNPGCNGYYFQSGSLPTQFSRGFYTLSVNSIGEAWPFYGASSCSNYFNGPFFAPIAVPDTVTDSGNFTTCNGGDLVFTGLVDFCSDASGLTGNSTLAITGPNGFTETINSGATGTTPIVDIGDYIITASSPNSPAQCVDCKRTACLTLTAADLSSCIALPSELIDFTIIEDNSENELIWSTATELNTDYFNIERKTNSSEFEVIGSVISAGYSSDVLHYSFSDVDPRVGISYYRLKQIDKNGDFYYSKTLSTFLSEDDSRINPNPNNGEFTVVIPKDNASVLVTNLIGEIIIDQKNISKGILKIDISDFPKGVYFLKYSSNGRSSFFKILNLLEN